MARGKPLTGFLLALVHSPRMTAAFNDLEQRPALLEQWGLAEHPLFANEDPTLTEVREAVQAEHQDDDEDEGESLLGGGGGGSGSGGPSVDVAWWIWFFGDPS